MGNLIPYVALLAAIIAAVFIVCRSDDKRSSQESVQENGSDRIKLTPLAHENNCAVILAPNGETDAQSPLIGPSCWASNWLKPVHVNYYDAGAGNGEFYVSLGSGRHRSAKYCTDKAKICLLPPIPGLEPMQIVQTVTRTPVSGEPQSHQRIILCGVGSIGCKEEDIPQILRIIEESRKIFPEDPRLVNPIKIWSQVHEMRFRVIAIDESNRSTRLQACNNSKEIEIFDFLPNCPVGSTLRLEHGIWSIVGPEPQQE